MATKRAEPQDRKPRTDPRGVQRIKLAGKSHLLRFDANAIIEAGDETGIYDILGALEAASNLNVKVLRGLLWAGLLHEATEDDELTLLEVGALIGDGKGQTPVMDVLQAVTAALTAALAGEKGAEEAAKALEDAAGPTRRGGTGTRPSAPRSQPASGTTSSGD